MHKKLQSENKEKLIKRLNMINEKLEPQFRLSQIDMEDLINSKTLSHSFATEAKTNWVSEEAGEEVLRRRIKEQRRLEYWRRRVKVDF
jgi:hypothetical protein